MTPGSIAIAVGLPLLIGWRLYTRIRRLIGRQQSRAWRHWAAAILFPLILALLALSAFRQPVSLAILGGAIVAGVALGIWGIRLTKFERTPAGYFYTPNMHIGIALSVLLVARIAYRFYEVSALAGTRIDPTMQGFARSPLTLVVLGMLASYYATYAMGVIRWRRKAPIPGSDPANQATATPGSDPVTPPSQT